MSDPDTGWTRCRYSGFYDVPLGVVIHDNGRTLLLELWFDEELDDYPQNYEVWELEPMAPELALVTPWPEIDRRKVRKLDGLPVKALEFRPKRERDGDRFYAWYRFRDDSRRVASHRRDDRE